LQLDSTFSERTYGVGSFRDFAQKLANAGHVRLREHGRNVLVELADGNGHLRSDDTPHSAHASSAADSSEAQPRDASYSREPQQVDLNPPPGGEPRAADGIRAVRRIFQAAQNPPRFPMYVRQAKQFMRNVDPTFDERTYGFGTLQDLLRACQRDGLFRIERDRQGVIRLFPGNIMQPSTGADDPEEDVQRDVIEAPAAESAQGWGRGQPPAVEGESHAAGTAQGDEARGEAPAAEVVDGDVVQQMEVQQVVDGEEAPPAAEEPKRGRGSRKRAAQPRAAKRTEGAPRARKAAAKAPRAPRARKTAGEG
jgi:hypothetical protein